MKPTHDRPLREDESAPEGRTFNIYMTGVGGQGIGLLSETLLRAAHYSGQKVKGVDTHGLAQRGGIVTSHLRIGPGVHSPLVAAGKADLVLALERTEALRSLLSHARPNTGSLVFYDVEWQPLPVRMGDRAPVETDHLLEECNRRRVDCHRVEVELADSRMQNVAIVATVAREGLIPGVTAEQYRHAMADLLRDEVLEKNLSLFNRLAQAVSGRLHPKDELEGSVEPT